MFTLQYDSTVTLRREPVVLESGYEQWLLYYPMVYSVFTCTLCVYVAVRFDRDRATGAGGTRVGLRAVAAVLPNGVLCVFMCALCVYVAVRFDRDPATGAGGTRVGLRAVAAVLPNGVEQPSRVTAQSCPISDLHVGT